MRYMTTFPMYIYCHIDSVSKLKGLNIGHIVMHSDGFTGLLFLQSFGNILKDDEFPKKD